MRPEAERDTINRAKETRPVNTDDRIRVLHLLPPSTGGMRTHVLTLLDHFDRRRFDISLAAPAAVQKSITEERLYGARFDALELAEVAEPLGLVYGSLHLSALLHRRRTHILHSHGIRAMLAAGLGGRTAPVRIATLHHPLSAGLSLAARHVVAYAYKTQTHCIATGQAIRNELLALGLPKERIAVISNGVAAHRPSAREVATALGEAGLPEGRPLAVIPSRYALNGGPELKEMVERLITASNCSIAFTGQAVDDPVLRDVREALPADRVFFCGYVRDLQAVLCGADVVALPAPGKATPLTALEAMACGVCVVTAPGGELAEVIADGVTGRVSPSNAAEPFAATVLSVLAARAEARRMGAAAREFVLEAFSADVMIRKLEALYIELLETTSGSTEGAAAQG